MPLRKTYHLLFLFLLSRKFFHHHFHFLLFFVFCLFHFHFIFSNSLFFFVTKQIITNIKKGFFSNWKRRKSIAEKWILVPLFGCFLFSFSFCQGETKPFFFFLLIVLNYSSLKFYSTSFYQKMLFDQNIILFSCLFLQLSFG